MTGDGSFWRMTRSPLASWPSLYWSGMQFVDDAVEPRKPSNTLRVAPLVGVVHTTIGWPVTPPTSPQSAMPLLLPPLAGRSICGAEALAPQPEKIAASLVTGNEFTPNDGLPLEPPQRTHGIES